MHEKSKAKDDTFAETSKIVLILIHYNTPQYLAACLRSIFDQTYRDIEILFIDNNSTDKTGLELLRNDYRHRPNLKVMANEQNLGYAAAANQGIKMALSDEYSADYIVVTNPDVLYTPTYFEKIIERIEKDPKIAAITGKIYKYDFDRDKPTNVIDSVGLFAYRNRRIIDNGQGLIDEGQFDRESEIFGVSGACPLYRREALEDVQVMDEYFDEDFFMYKEDVDLSWRFLLYGWKNLYFPDAVAYHGRGTGVFRRFFNKEILKNRSKLTRFQRKYSFTNQHLMEAKNELWKNFFKDLFPIMLKKIATFLYITLKEPFLWGSYLNYLKKLPKALKKRQIIMQNRKISVQDMRAWFKKQSEYLQK